jgi:hypothetical protein
VYSPSGDGGGKYTHFRLPPLVVPTRGPGASPSPGCVRPGPFPGSARRFVEVTAQPRCWLLPVPVREGHQPSRCQGRGERSVLRCSCYKRGAGFSQTPCPTIYGPGWPSSQLITRPGPCNMVMRLGGKRNTSKQAYSPKCVEEEFCELHLLRVLGKMAPGLRKCHHARGGKG